MLIKINKVENVEKVAYVTHELVCESGWLEDIYHIRLN